MRIKDLRHPSEDCLASGSISRIYAEGEPQWRFFSLILHTGYSVELNPEDIKKILEAVQEVSK